MTETFFTSDPHFGHANIITYCDRPFTDVDHMDAEMVRRWNAKVGDSDYVYILGDFSMGLLAVVEFAPQLNGIKYLIPGNHDRCHPVHKKHKKAEDTYRASGLIVTDTDMMLPLTKAGIRMNHFPYKGQDDTDMLYPQLRPVPKGELYLFHGHVHDKWRFKGDKMINVGVDQWNFEPVTSKEIFARYNEEQRITDAIHPYL